MVAWVRGRWAVSQKSKFIQTSFLYETWYNQCYSCHHRHVLLWLIFFHFLSYSFFKRRSTIATSENNSSLAPELPEKRKSYASTASSRASSVFSDPPSDPTCPLSPLSPSGNFIDSLGEKIPNPFPPESRGSSVSSESTLLATNSRPRVDDFASPSSNGYSYVSPPTSPRVPYDIVSSPSQSVASWVSESSYYSASSSFYAEDRSPKSPPLPKRDFVAGTMPMSSTPRNIDFFSRSLPTVIDSSPPLVPVKNRLTFSPSLDSRFISETTSSNTNPEMRFMSRDEPTTKPRTPVPIPRRGTVGSSSRPGLLSRSASDTSGQRLHLEGSGQERAPPPVKPRMSLQFASDQGLKTPPPKPPRPSQSSTPRAPPPKPKPYASKSAGSSPASKRKAENTEGKET